MLTKDLLINRKRLGVVTPFALRTEPGVLKLCEELIKAYSSGYGKTVQLLKERTSEIEFDNVKVQAGLEKILSDMCKFSDADATIASQRWSVLNCAQEIRNKGLQGIDWGQYQTMVSEQQQRTVENIEQTLYSDLAEFRLLTHPPEVDATWLIHRYNVAQVQGLILRSKLIQIELPKVSLAEKRALFRTIKFHQLMVANVVDNPGQLSFELSGPLTILESAQTYGVKIANFFPYLVQLPQYSLSADLTLNDREVTMTIDQKSGLHSHYKPMKAYVPKELVTCLGKFNDKYKPLKASISDSFLNLGEGSYCFPDIALTGDTKDDPVKVELFHRWHCHQLQARLATLGRRPVNSLKIGVCKSIRKRKEFGKILDNDPWFAKHGFEFREFPTPRQLANLVS